MRQLAEDEKADSFLFEIKICVQAVRPRTKENRCINWFCHCLHTKSTIRPVADKLWQVRSELITLRQIHSGVVHGYFLAP